MGYILGTGFDKKYPELGIPNRVRTIIGYFLSELSNSPHSPPLIGPSSRVPNYNTNHLGIPIYVVVAFFWGVVACGILQGAWRERVFPAVRRSPTRCGYAPFHNKDRMPTEERPKRWAKFRESKPVGRDNEKQKQTTACSRIIIWWYSQRIHACEQ